MNIKNNLFYLLLILFICNSSCKKETLFDQNSPTFNQNYNTSYLYLVQHYPVSSLSINYIPFSIYSLNNNNKSELIIRDSINLSSKSELLLKQLLILSNQQVFIQYSYLQNMKQIQKFRIYDLISKKVIYDSIPINPAMPDQDIIVDGFAEFNIIKNQILFSGHVKNIPKSNGIYQFDLSSKVSSLFIESNFALPQIAINVPSQLIYGFIDSIININHLKITINLNTKTSTSQILESDQAYIKPNCGIVYNHKYNYIYALGYAQNNTQKLIKISPDNNFKTILDAPSFTDPTFEFRKLMSIDNFLIRTLKQSLMIYNIDNKETINIPLDVKTYDNLIDVIPNK